MKNLIEYRLDDGTSVVVEVEESDRERGLARASRRSDEVVIQSSKRFEEIGSVVEPVAVALLGKVRALDHPPDEVNVQFGVKLTVSAGAVIAATAAECNFQLSLTWSRHG